MNLVTAVLLAVLILAAVCVVIFWNKKPGRSRVNLKTRLADFSAENENIEETAALKVENAKSRTGGINAQDHTGKGAHLNNIEVDKDINITTETPDKKKE